ncbi:hypothetical protein ACLMJK_009354 [Lecanora helva]
MLEKGLVPRFHTETSPEESKRNHFVTIISPLKARKATSAEEEKAAVTKAEGTVPIHAEFWMGATVVGKGGRGDGGEAVEEGVFAFVYEEGWGEGENGGEVGVGRGDGVFVEGVDAGDELVVEPVGDGDAEVVVLDSN